ncbi:MAG: hypothetical protein ACP5HU_02185 [Phycisphaerae bacterium]
MKTKRLLRRVLIAIVALVIILVVAAVLLIDPIAKSGVERGAGYALGVETSMDRMDVKLFQGQVIMDGLWAANPEGFATPHFFRSGRFDVRLKGGTVLSDPVEMEHFVLNGLDLNIEQKLTGSNVSAILENLRRFQKAPAEDAEQKPGKRLKIDRIEIRDVVAHFHIPGMREITVNLPVVELDNVTMGEEGGVPVSEIVARILPAVLAAVLEQGEGVLPAGTLDDLSGQLQQTADAMGQRGRELITQTREDISQRIEESAEQFREDITSRPSRALEDLLGGSSEDEQDADGN